MTRYLVGLLSWYAATGKGLEKPRKRVLVDPAARPLSANLDIEQCVLYVLQDHLMIFYVKSRQEESRAVVGLLARYLSSVIHAGLEDGTYVLADGVILSKQPRVTQRPGPALLDGVLTRRQRGENDPMLVSSTAGWSSDGCITSLRGMPKPNTALKNNRPTSVYPSLDTEARTCVRASQFELDCPLCGTIVQYPRGDSNARTRLRRPPLCPLSYGGLNRLGDEDSNLGRLIQSQLSYR